MLKNLLGAGIFLISAGSAAAADLPNKISAKIPMTKQSIWTGFYAGAQAGAAFSQTDFNVTPNGEWIADLPSAVYNDFKSGLSRDLKSTSFTGGLFVGYNYQFTNNILVGIEADVSLADLKDSKNVVLSSFDTDFSSENSFSSKWLVTARPRVGYIFDKFMVFGTAGMAVAEYKTTSGYNFIPSANLSSKSTSKETLVGWTAGAGVEYSFAPNWKLKTEYLYVDFGSGKTKNSSEPSFPNYTTTHKVEFNQHIGRVGVSYGF